MNSSAQRSMLQGQGKGEGIRAALILTFSQREKASVGLDVDESHSYFTSLPLDGEGGEVGVPFEIARNRYLTFPRWERSRPATHRLDYCV